MEGVYIFLADGFEDMEAIATRDVLLRGGVEVQTVSINEDPMIAKGAVFTPESAVVDGRLVTGRGAGHAVNFGLAILGVLKGEETVQRVKAGLML